MLGPVNVVQVGEIWEGHGKDPHVEDWQSNMRFRFILNVERRKLSFVGGYRFWYVLACS